VGGAINQNDGLDIRTTKVGDDTLLARIIRMVREAQGSNAPIQHVADRVAAIFVPAVIGVALLTFFAWLVFGPSINMAIAAGLAVLIIACPCALGLATPTAIIVGTGQAAAQGILFRGGEAIQRLQDVDVVVFDKTGTLTVGKPQVVA